MKFKLIFLFFWLVFTFSYADTSVINENNIFKNLRCLVCQGQSVAESNTDFAQTLKMVVKDQIKKGKSENEIYSFLTEKYGEWIVYKPNMNKFNFLLWTLPYATLLGGGFLIFLITRKKKG